MEILVMLPTHWVTIKKLLSIMKKKNENYKEIGDRAGEGGGCGSLGIAYDSLSDYQKAIQYHEFFFF